VHNTEYTPTCLPSILLLCSKFRGSLCIQTWCACVRRSFPSPIITLSAHSAPNNTVLAHLLNLVKFFISLCSKPIQVARFYARPMSRFSRSSRARLSLSSLICDLRVYLNKIRLTSRRSRWRNTALWLARLGSAQRVIVNLYLSGFMLRTTTLCVCASVLCALARSLGGLAFMRNEKQLLVCELARVHCLYSAEDCN
jgi:hypothetical protein